MKKKAVITGATGYIGSNLLRFLLSDGWDVGIISQPQFGYQNIEDVVSRVEVFEYDNNIMQLIDFLKKIDAEVVFHLAAAVINNYKPEQIPILIQSNIQFGTEVLEAMSHCSTRIFINTGSYWQNYNSEGYNPVDLYAATKEAYEKIIQYYVDAKGFRVVTLRLFDVYGEDDKRPKLLNLLYQISQGNSSIDISPGEQYLDMTHISDVCSAYLKAFELLQLDNSLENEIYGVYTGRRVQLKEMISLFEKILNQKLNVNIGAKPYKKREIMMPYTGYKQMPNWTPKVDLIEGLERIIKYKS
ncbi:NAD(P)-dependent oxidoreductase [Dysgonomonas sp. Marseille-P4677]|uniref:NAD-dependent epimerase/dehydratase family protein n=1 Tax=Dysgonomonas sp. Marseille-P4677 TaxID=2364790 RepID=UPI00191367F7|nr:NAD(P)-dependent oxidoreductase [Dysgonomonas sp. Marseille-P4677]MBK5719454.1 NAD(P)-dependent oxidoreductase [Dysgonomonas sp. Marseille-P4677]